MQCNNDSDRQKVLVFAGTTEGREFFASALRRGFGAAASVATQYGADELSGAIAAEDSERAEIRVGRLDEAQMCSFLRTHDFCAVVDATHPYAAEASANIFCACEREKIPYFRLKRNICFSCAHVLPHSREFLSIDELCNFLANTNEPCYAEGNIFISTGSKNLECFLKIPDFFSRAWVRVLPSAESIEKCVKAGIPRKRIIAMQGPFSADLNEAFFRECGIKILVTKESGAEGGFSEKLAAAKKCGIIVLMIKPPAEKSTRIFSAEEIFSALETMDSGSQKTAESLQILS